MKTLRMLAVEDDPALLSELKKLYRETLSRHGFTSITIEEASNAEEARSLAKAARANPYDLVSLDVNLGDQNMTGLDVLNTLGRFQAAWMVALLTGVETDTTVDNTMGTTAGNALRKRLRPDAYARFPAERLLVVEKPGLTMDTDARTKLLADRVEQIALIYAEVSRLRYIFRPLDVTSLERVKVAKGIKAKRKFIEKTSRHWQIRFNCGDIRTLPDKAGFAILHRLLRLDRNESLTPEAALVVEPANEKKKDAPVTPVDDPLADYFESKGVAWTILDGSVRTSLIEGALSIKLPRYRELRELEDEDDLSPNEEDELKHLKVELGPLVEWAEERHQAGNSASDDIPNYESPRTHAVMAQQGLSTGGKTYDKMGEGRRGVDSPEAMLFRARMKRVKDCLRENGFPDFAEHLDSYVQPAFSNWSYNPPTQIDWTT